MNLENCFKTFDLEVDYFIDKEDLILRRNQRIRDCHPDTACTPVIVKKNDIIDIGAINEIEDEEKKHFFESQSKCQIQECNPSGCANSYTAQINKHFQVLIDDISRAEHILELAGYEVEDKAHDMAMFVFKLHEKLARSGTEEECRLLKKEVEDIISGMAATICVGLKNCDYQEVLVTVQKARFLRGVVKRIGEKIRAMVLHIF